MILRTHLPFDVAQWWGGERRGLTPRRSRLRFWLCLDSACSSMYLCGVYRAALAPLCSLEACSWVGWQLLIVSVCLRACVYVVCQHCDGVQACSGSCGSQNGPWPPCNTDNGVSVSTHGGWMLISVAMGVQLLLVAKNRVHLATIYRQDPMSSVSLKSSPLVCRNEYNGISSKRHCCNSNAGLIYNRIDVHAIPGKYQIWLF